MLIFGILLLLTWAVFAVNFGFEDVQLTEAEMLDYPAIRFADPARPSPPEKCRYTPGDEYWPSEEDWLFFNDTLGGVLLRPQPLAIPCYAGLEYNANKCATLQSTWTNMAQHANHPISVMSQWSSGMSCVPTNNPNSTCVQGGFPVYVVNATTVRHVQMAVNFARNNNIRLVIKNSGHDFNGKAIGGGSLSIWVHNLKGITYYDNFKISGYNGRAIALAGGTRATEFSAEASRRNTTVLSAGGPDVAIAGGFFQGAGHSSYASLYGLAADHVLRIGAVTADGAYVVADQENNPDLFWAFRGGGGGTFGVVTSIVVRTFPLTRIARTDITFSTLPRSGRPGVSNETFWAGIRVYLKFSATLCDEKGFSWDNLRHGSSAGVNGLTFTTSIQLPNRTAAELQEFIKPYLQKLSDIGILVGTSKTEILALPDGKGTQKTASLESRAIGDTVGNTLISSRIFERGNFADNDSISTMLAVVRSTVVEGGYDIHPQVMSPTLEISGNPDNAVVPAFRRAVMHVQAFEPNAYWDSRIVVESAVKQAERHRRLDSFMQKWRDITPGGGAYINEGDMQDGEWKRTFYGENYEKLLQVKDRWDPEGVFWCISGVGSDRWEVSGSSGGGRKGLYTQDGRLCRVGDN